MLTESQKLRYQRQIRQIGEQNQEKLLTKKVVQIGAGGLGSPLAYYLVAAGVGELSIIDYDTVSLSNLNRQILYTAEDIDHSKAKSAEKRLSRLNPDVKINSFDVKITPDNFEKYCKGADYLIDASDNMSTKFLTNDIGLQLEIPFTIAGVQELEGQIISVDPYKSTCYRCVFGGNRKNKTEAELEEEKKETERRRLTLGIFGFTAGMFGCMEAAEAIKQLLGIGTRLLNTMIMIDLVSMNFMRINVARDPKCICNHKL